MMKKSMMVVGLYIGLISVAWAQESWQSVTDSDSAFQQGFVQVVGMSEEGQSRYRALRAAQVVAQRDLLEALQGLTLTGATSVKDGMLESDEIRTSVEGFLKGATKCGEKYHSTHRYAEVCMRVNIRGRGGVYETLLPLVKEDRLVKEKKPAYQPSNEEITQAKVNMESAEASTGEVKPEVAAPTEIENPHDGLIIDARGFQFRPALVNRIVTDKDQVVFDPSKILSNVLVERGCGGFTTDDGKAKALLDTWGSKNPMLIRCVDVANFTEAKISQDDAAAVYVHDQKSNLLAQARVVFLLK
jgi:hypothetical protein